ncbi:MAG: Na+/H+ antiporter subunit E [Planctomycetaceae bacterium]
MNDAGSLLQRWLPHPLLTLFLISMWIALAGSISGGSLIMGSLLGLLIPVYTGNFWPDRPVIRSPIKAIVFLVILAWDVLVANLLVAWIILFRPAAKMRSQWIAVPLDLESPEAITALAATITLTPGTVTSDLAADGRTLLVHCLDVADPNAEVQRIKRRYESRIKAIFP